MNEENDEKGKHESDVDYVHCSKRWQWREKSNNIICLKWFGLQFHTNQSPVSKIKVWAVGY